MTLSDIIVAALAQLGRGHDQRSLDTWRRKFTRFANDAICDIAATMKLYRTESMHIEGSTIDTVRLSRPCLKVLAVTQDGFPLKFTVGEGSGLVCVRGTGVVEVTYRYIPDTVQLPSDVPEIPEYMHGLIVSYVVARERMSGDTSSQKGYDAYMQLYEIGKMKLLSAATEENSIENKW